MQLEVRVLLGLSMNKLLFVSLFMLWQVLWQTECFGVNSAVGLLLVEESDDRPRPGIMLQLGDKNYESRFFYYARTFGPVVEHSWLLTFANNFPLPIMKHLFGSMGFVLLQESTYISFASRDRDFNTREDRFNLGGYLGLHWTYQYWNRWFLQFGWDASLFPAGTTGGILLATGRKQLITFSTGYRW